MKLPSLMYVLALGVSLGGLAMTAGCGSDGPSGPTGGPVTGAVDMHCIDNGVQIKQPIGACVTGPVGDGGASPTPDGGAEEDGGAIEEPAAVMFNAEGDDDDCKYRVKWTSSAVRLNADVTFDVSLKKLVDGAGAPGGDVSIEAFLNDTHPTPSTNIVSTESAGGNYKVGPVRFDQAGMWTVRFHYYEECSDIPEDSPHGHAAFYLMVP